MKKILSSFALVIIAIISFSQTHVSTEASVLLAFKGVPIDRTLNDYVLQLKKNGFNHIGTEDGIAMF